MKKLFLTFGIFILSVSSFNCYSQENIIDTDDLIGWWMADKDFCDVFFWIDIHGKLQVQQISNYSGEPFITSIFTVNHDSVFIKSTVFAKDSETSTTSLNRFTFIDGVTMECVSTDFKTKEVKVYIFSKMK